MTCLGFSWPTAPGSHALRAPSPLTLEATRRRKPMVMADGHGRRPGMSVAHRRVTRFSLRCLLLRRLLGAMARVGSAGDHAGWCAVMSQPSFTVVPSPENKAPPAVVPCDLSRTGAIASSNWRGGCRWTPPPAGLSGGWRPSRASKTLAADVRGGEAAPDPAPAQASSVRHRIATRGHAKAKCPIDRTIRRH